jgi:hypothetical protein
MYRKEKSRKGATGPKSWCWGTTLETANTLPGNCGSRVKQPDKCSDLAMEIIARTIAVSSEEERNASLAIVARERIDADLAGADPNIGMLSS